MQRRPINKSALALSIIEAEQADALAVIISLMHPAHDAIRRLGRRHAVADIRALQDLQELWREARVGFSLQREFIRIGGSHAGHPASPE